MDCAFNKKGVGNSSLFIVVGEFAKREMNITYKPNKSMEKFHKDKNIEALISICMINYHNPIFDDIVASISFPNKDLLIEYLDRLEENYINTPKIHVFHEYKELLLNLFENSQVKNLKGAFLEVLSQTIFEYAYRPQIIHNDCIIGIDEWYSDLTVDIAFECSNGGLICECKVPASKFNWDIFRNLLDIYEKSDYYFSPFAVTLNNRESIEIKKERIMNVVAEANNLDEIHIIAREDLSRFNFS